MRDSECQRSRSAPLTTPLPQDLVLTTAAQNAGPITLDSASRASRRNDDFEHPLARICSQIRAEVKSMLYARNKFTITIRHRHFAHLRTWLDLVGAQHVPLISSLDILLEERDFPMNLALRELIDVLGPRRICFRVRTVNLGYAAQPGRRENGRGRYKKKGWKG